MFPVTNYEGILEAQRRDLLNPINDTAAFADLVTMDKVQAHDDSTQGSGSGGSAFSDFSALENETDEFGRRLLQHQRDVQRLNNAARGQLQPQAFRKARPRARIAQPYEREGQNGVLHDRQDHQRTGSAGSNDSDPPVTVPRDWGRKAKRQKDWMRKILEPSEDGEDAIYPHRTAFTGDDNPISDLRNNSDEPVQSVERPMSTPSSMRHMNSTLVPNGDHEDGDFSSASLLTSTPASRLPRKIDELARREIESIERGASTNSPSRPKHVRNDSMSLLRKLARVSSMSPTPKREQPQPVRTEDNQDAQPVKRGPVAPELVFEERLITPLEDILDLALDRRKPAVSGSAPVDLPARPRQDYLDIRRVKTAPAVPKDAPVTALVKATASEVHVPLVSTQAESPVPKSALEAIVHEAKHGGQQYGESTIQSLEDIVHPALDGTEELRFEPDAQESTEDKLEVSQALTQAEKDRRQEDLAMEAMNKHLRAARTNIKDANRGLRRVENRIETAQEDLPAQTRLRNDNLLVVQTYERHYGHHYCDSCGGGYQSVWYALWAEFRSCFYVYDSKSKWGVRLTALGIACLVLWCWYMTESTLCDFYCNPLYAYKATRRVDVHAPRFPAVIPTLMFRKAKWLLRVLQLRSNALDDWE